MKLAPICLFTYNRLEETQQTVKALANNFLAKESELYIFSDGWKNDDAKIKVNNVRAFLKTINGFKKVTVFESDKNKGLASSIVDGVSKIINQEGKVIVLEDDLISTPNFLSFMNSSLKFYENSNKIQSINGYSLKLDSKEEIYFQQRTFSWGWGTWKSNWSKDLFDKEIIKSRIREDSSLLSKFNKSCGNDMSVMLQDSISGVNNSWYVRWVFDHFLKDNYAVYPSNSKIHNSGFNDEATHCLGINTYVSEMDVKFNQSFSLKPFDKSKVDKDFLVYFTKKYRLLYRFKLLKKNPFMLPKLIFEIKDRIILRLKVLPKRLKNKIT